MQYFRQKAHYSLLNINKNGKKVTKNQRREKKSVKKDSVFYIHPKGDTWEEHKKYVEDFAEDMYEFIREREEKVNTPPTMTAAFAGFVSKGFQFEDFSFEEVQVILYRNADRLRKNARKK